MRTPRRSPRFSACAGSACAGCGRSSRPSKTSSCRSSIRSARRACASSFARWPAWRHERALTPVGSRLYGIIVKEFIHLKRDPLAVTLALFVPVAMLFIFGWAINTDVKHVPTVVLDQSASPEARILQDKLVNSQYFDLA